MRVRLPQNSTQNRSKSDAETGLLLEVTIFYEKWLKVPKWVARQTPKSIKNPLWDPPRTTKMRQGCPTPHFAHIWHPFGSQWVPKGLHLGALGHHVRSNLAVIFHLNPVTQATGDTQDHRQTVTSDNSFFIF